MIVGALGGLRVGVHERGRQPGQRVQQGVLRGDGDLVARDGSAGGVDGDLAFGAELVADPAEPDLPYVEHPRHGPQRLLGLVDQGRVDCVHEPAVDPPGSLPEPGQARDGDHHDGHAGQVLGPPVTAGVTAVRRPPAHHERDRQRHAQRDPQHPHALRPALHRGINLVRRIMRVRAHPVHQPRLQASTMPVIVIVIVFIGTGPVRILDERLARGEINADEYAQLRKALASGSSQRAGTRSRA